MRATLRVIDWSDHTFTSTSSMCVWVCTVSRTLLEMLAWKHLRIYHAILELNVIFRGGPNCCSSFCSPGQKCHQATPLSASPANLPANVPAKTIYIYCRQSALWLLRWLLLSLLLALQLPVPRLTNYKDCVDKRWGEGKGPAQGTIPL